MKQVSSIDLHFIIKELKELEDSKINNVYSEGNKTVTLDIYTRNKGSNYLIVDDCKYIYISKKKKAEEQPSGFCMFLRKKLKNSIIRSIEQIGVERIIKITIEGKDKGEKEEKNKGKEEQNKESNEDDNNHNNPNEETESTIIPYYLYIELFNKGNIILCDKDNKIIGLAEAQRWSDRNVLMKNQYEYPKSTYNFHNIKSIQIIDEVKIEKSLVKALASKFSMGGIYAEEVCERAKIDKDKEEISEKEANLIIEKVNEILNQDLFPKIVYKEQNNILTISPIELELFKNKESKAYESISNCYEEALVSEKSKLKDNKNLTKYNEKIAQLKNRIEEQEKYIEELGEVEISNRDKGNKIYENYGDVNDLMNEVKKKLKESTVEEVKKEYSKNKNVKEITHKSMKMVL